MAVFRVGQRVKKVRSTHTNGDGIGIPIGAEVLIVRYEFIPAGSICQGRRYSKNTDLIVRYNGTDWGTLSECYEPINPEGHQVIRWAECIWQPEHLKESA